jgi:hypothetical protein
VVSCFSDTEAEPRLKAKWMLLLQDLLTVRNQLLKRAMCSYGNPPCLCRRHQEIIMAARPQRRIPTRLAVEYMGEQE